MQLKKRLDCLRWETDIPVHVLCIVTLTCTGYA